ncbi:hypothetical protein GCM10023075_43890 [Streptosporangium album]
MWEDMMAQAEAAEQFAARLRMLKSRAGNSFETLAGRTGISRSSLHRYCSGAKLPADFGTVHAFARACGASNDELRDLHRLWALADVARSSPLSPGRAAADQQAERAETGEQPTAQAEQPTARRGVLASWSSPRTRRTASALVAVVLVAATATVALMLRTDRKAEAPTAMESRSGTSTTAPMRVFNIEGDCKSREGRVPACSMGLARDPRLKYDAGNVVSHRVWHDDVLNADCVLYDGDRVEDERGVGTTRWFRVRLDNVAGGFAWLPGVRTQDSPKLPTCAV